MTLVYHHDRLGLDGVDLATLAEQFGTPLYVYSQPALIRAACALDAALAGPTPHLICYAVKANPTLAVIQTFARLGCGADVTSAGELYRALQAGIPAERIVYSGVGKTIGEMQQALTAGIRAFHVESSDELNALAGIAASQGRVAPITLRVNPDVDPRTHPYIATGLRTSKFGIPWEQVPALLDKIRELSSVRLCGLSVHIGSQITELEPIKQAAECLVGLAHSLLEQRLPLEYLDFGGGLGVRYHDEKPPTPEAWGTTLRATLGTLPLDLLVEPGRVLVAEAGVLLTRVLAIKQAADRTLVVVDAGMNDLLRPALYQAYHAVWPVVRRPDAPNVIVDVVGPVCESTDRLAQERVMPLPCPGDLLAVLGAGAYGSSMASNYNSRLRPAEVMLLDQDAKAPRPYLIRARETLADLTRGEKLLS